MPARRVLTRLARPVTEDSETVTAFRNGEVVRRSERRTEGFTESTLDIGYQGVEPGDLVVHAMDGFAGAIGISKSSGKMSPVVHIYTSSTGVDLRYIQYFLQHLANAGYVQALAKGIRERSTSFDPATLADIQIPMPPVEEQRNIADFLDDQVALIDAMTQLRLAQSVASDEVLRAYLDYEFAPQRTAVWSDRPLRATCSYFTDGDWIESPYITDAGIRLIQTGNVGVGEYSEQGFRYISEETFVALNCKPVIPGDVLISRLGSPVARACLAPDSGGPAVTSVDVVIARPSEGMVPEFLVWYLTSPRHLSDSDQLARGATMQRLSRTQLGAIRVPTPSISEQQEVCSRLTTASDAVKSSSQAIRQSLNTLQEYRRSLITAAVTGELDVTTARPVVSA